VRDVAELILSLLRRERVRESILSFLHSTNSNPCCRIHHKAIEIEIGSVVPFSTMWTFPQLRTMTSLLGALILHQIIAFTPHSTICHRESVSLSSLSSSLLSSSSSSSSHRSSWSIHNRGKVRRIIQFDSPHRTTALQVSTSNNDQGFIFDLLDDDKGHINSELAQRIWKWEKQQRVNLQLPDFAGYSTRQGLKWVKEIMIVVGKSGSRTLSSSSSPSTSSSSSTASSASTNYDDLVQEGVIALMQALKTFEHDSRPTETFEMYAKTKIRNALEDYTLQHDKGAGVTTPTTGSSRNGWWSQSNNNPGGTRFRRMLPLSVESTVEITDPLLETVERSHYVNQDDWEVREGLVLDNGRSVRREELVEEFLDEMIQYEGEDQMWLQTQSVAAPLKDSIPDTSVFHESDDDDDPADALLNARLMKYNGEATSVVGAANRSRRGMATPDDLALTDMILYNVDDFLGNTLDELESQVIQMRFGLDDGLPQTQKEIAIELGMSITKVRKLQKEALAKLRANFTDKYVNDDTSHEDYWEDTV
jgi:RNA polymerase sigma factor (sigma-70 family)